MLMLEYNLEEEERALDELLFKHERHRKQVVRAYCPAFQLKTRSRVLLFKNSSVQWDERSFGGRLAEVIRFTLL